MNQVILASHGGLAEGARDTLSMVLGDVSNVHVVSLARDDKEPIAAKVEALLAGFDANDAVYVCTDMLGSSVNNSVTELMNNGANITVISGMNLPLVLSLVMAPEPVVGEELASLIAEARRGLRDVSAPEEPVASPKKRAVSHKQGPAKIVLARLDYRLIHGQVVLAWQNKINAERIIVVDNAAATDEVKKGALRLAKPQGVYLNVYTVERALSKMNKLNTLGENVMLIFGNMHEMLEFNKGYKLASINLGASANHDGADPVGGKDSSVFLDAQEKADVNELMSMGIEVYEQQTPTQTRTNITNAL